MRASERLQTIQDVIYLVRQMILAERRVGSVVHLVFYYEQWGPPNAVRLTADEERFLHDAILETFLLSYRNLIDFFHRLRRAKNTRGDSCAEADFSFRRELVPDADGEFSRVSKHLAHLSEVRRTRAENETWDLTAVLIACRPTIKDFFAQCERDYSTVCAPLQAHIYHIVSGLEFLGTAEHFITHKHASRSPFMAHGVANRISIPPPEKAENGA